MASYPTVLYISGLQMTSYPAVLYMYISGLQMASYPAVLISDLKLIKEVLVDRAEVFYDRPLFLPWIQALFGKRQGLIFANGDKWKFHKKLTSTAFRKYGISAGNFERNILGEAKTLIEELKVAAGTDYQFGSLFKKASGNVICAVLFGSRCVCVELVQIMA